MKSDEKTNVMRLLDSRKIPYAAHTYAPDPALSGEDIARILGKILPMFSKPWSPVEKPADIMFS